MFSGENMRIIAFIGITLAFLLTGIATKYFQKFLPRDKGRDFAFNGKLSEGKPRGAGIIFVCVFCAVSLIFGNLSLEMIVYIVLVFIEMLTGYLDDSSTESWNEYKKGIMDLLVSGIAVFTYLINNEPMLRIASLGIKITISKPLFAICAVILIWVSINVTNCSDGVDELAGTLSITSFVSFGLYAFILVDMRYIVYYEMMFIACLLGYQWYNATPSKLMMGDAGSRAIGFFLSIVALKVHAPLLFIPFALVLVLDGGLGLLKVSLLRFFKIKILKNVRTPLHDHVRKNRGWSNSQTVYRFTIIQIFASSLMLFAILTKQFGF